MGLVHDVLEAEGKQAALKADIARKVVEAAADYMADEEAGIGFLYSGWCQAALPHRRLPDETSWPNFDSGFGKAVSGQQLMRPRLVFSITRDDLR